MLLSQQLTTVHQKVLVEVIQLLADLLRAGAVLSQVEIEEHVDLGGQKRHGWLAGLHVGRGSSAHASGTKQSLNLFKHFWRVGEVNVTNI